MQGCRVARLIGYDGGMQPFQFSLRMLFVAVAVVCIPLSWIGYHLNWIRQRHAFLAQYPTLPVSEDREARAKLPFGLDILDESPHMYIEAPREHQKEAARLFPEALVIPPKYFGG